MKSTVILCLSPSQCDSVCVCAWLCLCCNNNCDNFSCCCHVNLPSWGLSNNYAIQNDAMISLNVPNKYFVIDSRVNKRTSSYCHMADAGHGDGYGNGAALVALMVHKLPYKVPHE